MNEERKKPVWPWIVGVLIGLPVLYLLSLGPWVWFLEHRVLPDSLQLQLVRATETYAKPSNCLYDHAPRPVQRLLESYIRVWSKEK